jgi:hypothetical protein
MLVKQMLGFTVLLLTVNLCTNTKTKVHNIIF